MEATDEKQFETRFDKAKRMLERAAKETKLKYVPLKLINTVHLPGCSDLKMNNGKLFFHKDERHHNIDYISKGICCESYSIHMDGHPIQYVLEDEKTEECYEMTDEEFSERADEEFSEWFNFLENEIFSIRVLHFTVNKPNDDSLSDRSDRTDEGGKVVIDFASGEKFNKDNILHRLVVQNYHNGYYSHSVMFYDHNDDVLPGFAFYM
jgi:hypothetical protein